MKIVAINGSPRIGGNTASLVNMVFEPLEEAGIECVHMQTAGKVVLGCTACAVCYKRADGQCHGRDDFVNVIIEELKNTDGIILASPVYFADVSSDMKAVIDRVGYVSRANGSTYARKPGAAIVAVRRAGAIHALDTMSHFFLIGEMMMVGSSYWNIGVGRQPGDVLQDEEGVRTMRRLGENMAWLLGKLKQEGR